MHLTVIGIGYVGLVTAVCFAEMGNHVACVDIDSEKMEGLEKGILPIHEPGLAELVDRNLKRGGLFFTTSFAKAVEKAEVIFIAVGTPSGEDGSADLSHVLAAAGEIGRHLKEDAVVVNKSTVPVGAAQKVRERIQQHLDARGMTTSFAVVSNPEFLKEGDAIKDFMRPDRIVIGTDSEWAEGTMRRLYAHFSRNHEKILVMGVRDAEMTKYAANAMLATKISFMNEMAGICERVGVDVENVRRGIGSDSRIGYDFIYAGCGYGGSCFPKDVKALIRSADLAGFSPRILQAVSERNHFQKKRLFEKIRMRIGSDLKGAVVGVWGLSFKPGTDDLREAPSRVLIAALIAAGAKVLAYDPVAMEAAGKEFPEKWFAKNDLTLVPHQYAAAKGVDALAVVTEWKPFRQPDFIALKKMMGNPFIFDGRNLYDPEELAALGFYYTGIGRGTGEACGASSGV